MGARRTGAGRWLWWGGLLLALGNGVQAQTKAPERRVAAPAADEARAGLEQLYELLRLALTVSPGHPADAELQAAAKAMVEAQLPRMRALLSTWLDEERRLSPGNGLGRHLFALNMRVQNELSLWLLDSGGPEHDRRQQQALLRPRACEGLDRSRSVMEDLVQVWQQVPAAQRAAHLQAEAERLRRWGLPRPAAPPRPLQSVDELAWRAIDDHVATQKPLPQALPPILAWRALSAAPDVDLRRQPETLCALRQWALGVALQQGRGTLSAEQWVAHRYARMPQQMPAAPPREGPAPSLDAYPEPARRMQVEGDITVEVALDAKGGWLGATVVRREVRVPGIRGQRPVSFEMLLDEASLARAAALPRQPPEKTQDGRAVRSVTFKYQLQ